MPIDRYYGNDRGSLGDILHNTKYQELSCKLKLGALGSVTVYLTKRDDGCYDLSRKYKDGTKGFKSFKIGRTFPVKNKDKIIVEGLTQGGLALLSEYDPGKERDVFNSNDCLMIVTHESKEKITINENLIKVGYITGKFAVEKLLESDKKSQKNEENEIPF